MAQKIIFHSGDDPEMLNAYKKAQETFGYFWRELYWEYRRIIPALDIGCVKVAFSQETDEPDNPIIEHMWINEINFDGFQIYGVLINEPNELTNIKNGDNVIVTLSQVSDWLFAIAGKTYGGFTIQLMRSYMSDAERQSHDTVWGLEFGDFNNILVAYEQETAPNNLIEHPMSINSKQNFADFLSENLELITTTNDNGEGLIHQEAIVGNRSNIEVLLAKGGDKSAKTNDGKTALDYAKMMNWKHLYEILE